MRDDKAGGARRGALLHIIIIIIIIIITIFYCAGLSVCLSVCLLTSLSENEYRHKTFSRDGQCVISVFGLVFH